MTGSYSTQKWFDPTMARQESSTMTLKNVLLLGSTSFTGSHILHHLAENYHFRCVGRDSNLVDVVHDIQSDETNSLAPHLDWADVVINCFSNGDVDSCETNPGPSTRLNLDFPKELCSLQKVHNFHLVHFSSNAVYDGDNPLYSEQCVHEPVNTYGKLKSEADKYLMRNSDACTVLRPITMYGQVLGRQRHNPFSFFHERLVAGDDITAVNDVYVNMLHVDVLVQCVKKVIDAGVFGEFNISGDDVVNRFEFVSEIKRHIPLSTSQVTETDSAGFVTAARRPLDTSFDNSRMKAVLGVHPTPLSSTIEALVAQATENNRSDGTTQQEAA